MAKKTRLDELIVAQGLADNLLEAQKLVMAGEIRTGDRVWDKSGEKIPTETQLEVKTRRCKWVSRGGLKLERAIISFAVDTNSKRCLDIGASTGGFTDVLLSFGAAHVVAVDVGYGLLDAKLQNDARVTIKDRTNFKQAQKDDFGDPFDIAVTDVSFISLEKILPPAVPMLKPDGIIIALIKPQFEAERHLVPTGGIVTDPATHIAVINHLKDFFENNCNLYLHGLEPVPLVDKKKNIEFLSLWRTIKRDAVIPIEETVLKAHNRNY